MDHSLDVRTRSCDEGQLVNDIRREIDGLLGSISKTKSKAERREKYKEIRSLRKEASWFHSIRSMELDIHDLSTLFSF